MKSNFAVCQRVVLHQLVQSSGSCHAREKRVLSIITLMLFEVKISSAYYVCCIFSNAIQNTSTTEANTMNPDQTAPKGAV